MMPINILTGFLGSGKTTLLRKILKSPAFSDTAVIVNEIGEIGLDHLLLEEVEEGVLLLESGCICCTIRVDLQQTIRSLLARADEGSLPQFRRLVIETTGLADPAPIVSTIAADTIIRNHFRLGNIICTVDALNGTKTLQNQPEMTKQIAVADRIVMTKIDLAAPRQVEKLVTQVRALNPFAVLSQSSGKSLDADALVGGELADPEHRLAEVSNWTKALARISSDSDGHHAHHGPDQVQTFALVYETPIDWTAFGIWLTALLHVHGHNILRVKGILNVLDSDTPVVIHGVQHVVHAPMHLENWPDGDRTSRIIFIGRGIDEVIIRQSLAVFMNLAERTAPDSKTPALEK